MPVRRNGTYFDGQREIRCRIKRVGSQNTRIALDDGTEKLVPTERVKIEAAQVKVDAPERLIPTTPLEIFYRAIRKLEGSKPDKFQALWDLLNGRYGPKGPNFLEQLFRRSVRHAESYANIGEGFYSARPPRKSDESPFAKLFVKKLSESDSVQIDGRTLVFVDYEIYPFRTTYSCLENGRAASRSGSGGMDLLLALENDSGIIPAVGEVKAATETVGPTFALVQSLMYAAQLTTPNQFIRLSKHYSNTFAKLNADKPKVDVLVFLEAAKQADNPDLAYALDLAENLATLLSDHLESLRFVQCAIANDAIECAVIKAQQQVPTKMGFSPERQLGVADD